MKKTIIACCLSLLMAGGVLYGEEPAKTETNTAAAVKAERDNGKRIKRGKKKASDKQRKGRKKAISAQSGTSQTEADSASAEATQRKGRTNSIANIKAMDKDNDGNISKSEASGKLARHFDDIDTDKDGTLSQAELSSMEHHNRKDNQKNTDKNNRQRGKKRQRQSID